MHSQRTDVAVLFALEEEFKEFYPEIESKYSPDIDEKTGRTFLLFDRSSETGPSYHCVTTFIGTMGAQDAAYLTGLIIDRYEPHTIVLAGIAGSLSDDVLLGDVVVADQIDDYLQDAKYADQAFSLAGRVYLADSRLTNVIRYFRFSYPPIWEELSQRSWSDAQTVISKSQLQKPEVIVRINGFEPRVGHIASGAVVAADSGFGKWLRHRRDRKFLAIEMEAAGVMNAVYVRAGNQRVLVLRGISDFSDDRKAMLDRVGSGAFRGLATRNAVRLLLALFQAGLLERTEDESPQTHETRLSVRQRSPEQWVADLTGPDPVAGVSAIEPIVVDPKTYVPLLADVIWHRSFDLQLKHRMPIVFGKFGPDGVEALVEILQSGKWWPMRRAAQCFRYIRDDRVAGRVAKLIQTEFASKIDISRQALMALGWMAASQWRVEICNAPLESGSYAFEKLSAFAFGALSLIMVHSHAPQEIADMMGRIERLLGSSVADEKFGAGHDIEEDWRYYTQEITPEAEDGLLKWFDGEDEYLTGLAIAAYRHSRNPRLLQRMIEMLQRLLSAKQPAHEDLYSYLPTQDAQPSLGRLRHSAIQDIYSYLRTQDTDKAYTIAEKLLDGRWRDLGLELLSCMMYRAGKRWAEINREIQAWRSPRATAQVLYTSGASSEVLALAGKALDADDPAVRAAGTLSLSITLGREARKTVQPLPNYAPDPIERALMLAACVRCGVEGSTDALHTALGELGDSILETDYLWRRELAFTVSRTGPQAQQRGQAWGELLGVSFPEAEEQVNRFAPFHG